MLLLFAVQCIYSIFVGGDYTEPLNAPQIDAANRFIAQGMPSLLILSGVMLGRLLEKAVNTIKKNKVLTANVLFPMIIVATITIVSGVPWLGWAINNAPLLESDIWRAKRGIQINEFTNENAVIAVHAAGQISYYSNRRSIDLLGKSDPVIAKSLPSSTFRPGHNKWNYEYSILTLKPDLIADEWGVLPEFLRNNESYYRLENGIYVRKDSTYVDAQGLTK